MVSKAIALLGFATVWSTQTTTLVAQQPGVAMNPATGYYDVTYRVSGDTLHPDTYFPGNLVDPQVSCSVAVDSMSERLVYQYEVGNRVGAHPTGLFAFGVVIDSPVSDITSPSSEWIGDTSTSFYDYSAVVDWAHTRGFATGIAPGFSESGYSYRSSGLPSVAQGYAQSSSTVNWKEDGPSGPVAASFDSLEQATRFVALLTLAPRDPPDPFDLGDFLDTLGTYPLRSALEGWMRNSTAAELDRLLNDASSAIGGGDSTRTATLLRTVLDHVEAVKDDSLSSEGYALMKYNIEHALEYLPLVVTRP